MPILGIVVLIGLVWAMSLDRRHFPWLIVVWGLGLQFAFGLIVLKTPGGRWVFERLGDGVTRIIGFTKDGARFVFGKYVDGEFTIALGVLPTIVFFSTLMALLYHLGVMQRVVRAIAWVMQKTLRTSGAETLSAAGNIFLGQTEAPLLVRPFVPYMTRSELMAVMVCGFATAAGGVLAAYVGLLQHKVPNIAGHLIAASVMNAPAGLMLAKILLPERDTPKTQGSLVFQADRPSANVIDAAAKGASEGMHLALNVGAMLLAFLSLVALVNFLFGLPAEAFNSWKHLTVGAPGAWTPLSLERLLGWVFWPVAWVIGIPKQDCGFFAELLGQKIVINEFVAYLRLSDVLDQGRQLHPRTILMATYALCGFANFASIAVQIGGIGGMAPERRSELATLSLRAMIGGAIASLLSACVAGVLST